MRQKPVWIISTFSCSEIFTKVLKSWVNDISLIFCKLINKILKLGNSLVVSKLDRCSRNTLSFLQLKHLLSEKGVIFRVLNLPQDYLENSASSQLISTALAAIAEFETATFKDSQVKNKNYTLEDAEASKYVADCILLEKGSDPKDAECVFNYKTGDCIVFAERQEYNRETRSWEESPVLEYVGPRSLNNPKYNNKFQRYGIVGSDGKDISQAQHGMTAKELIEIRANQEKLAGESDQCLPNQDQ